MESNESSEDEILLKRLKRGNEDAFRRIYLKYHKQLYRVALKTLRSKTLSEDAVQDIFVKLWNHKKKLRKSGSLKGFLLTALKNHVLNMVSTHKRKLKKHVEVLYEQKQTKKVHQNIYDLSKYREIYQEAIKQLPKKRKEVFRLRIKEGLTNQEVADYLEISIHTVKSQYYQASKFIREYVSENTNLRSSGT